MPFALRQRMAGIGDKVQMGLDEARTLLLGTEVLLGFQYNSVFQPGFNELPEIARHARALGLVLTIITVMLLISPASFHRLVERGEGTYRVHHFTTVMMKIGLLPFALSLGVDLFIVVARVDGIGAGIAIGIFTSLVALFFWYGLEFYYRAKRGRRAMEEHGDAEKGTGGEEGGTTLHDRVQHVLTESRVVLPGAQALLGFQFVAMLTDQFMALPDHSKYVHLASLATIALSTIMLMSPASYHRIVDRGEDTEEFHRFAGRMVLAAMIPLAIGISGDVYVVTERIFFSEGLAALVASAMLAGFFGLWFLLPLAVRGGERKGAGMRKELGDMKGE